ncbi:hypothetical protein M3689_19435 [Alkalihalophilus marmarensis]|uniref:Uncharacterized protein n=1 Tax=Alkalihalophilus marmarensis DSM 21297 TaxID=1188261 RepID=U6SH21_9BACI|nr:hypothetical protein [Alkalihalophilus marmarensis]ERN51024.1 hypothetical protein A33I_21040 [Alkalihalophilus marmarensis DSM 21297]MCM3491466.1 hypothetical protein [Alkalihalophilus marmarensis]
MFRFRGSLRQRLFIAPDEQLFASVESGIVPALLFIALVDGRGDLLGLAHKWSFAVYAY